MPHIFTNPLDIFSNAKYFERYAKYTGIVLLTTLIQMGEYICSPEFQRFRSQCKVESIVQHEENYYKKHKRFDFNGTIHICYNKADTKYYIIDGQHRFEAANILFNKTRIDVQLLIELHIVTKPVEMEIIWNTLNHNTRLPEFAYPYIKPIAEAALADLVEKYPDFFVCSVNIRKIKRPRMSQTIVLEELGKIVDELKLKCWEELIKIVLDYNVWMVSIPDVTAYFNNRNGEQYQMETRLMYKTAKRAGMFLGLYKLKSTGYDWTREIIDMVKKDRRELKNTSTNNMVVIPSNSGTKKEAKAKKVIKSESSKLTKHEKSIIQSNSQKSNNSEGTHHVHVHHSTKITPLNRSTLITECPYRMYA
jgi:hypothetical protein